MVIQYRYETKAYKFRQNVYSNRLKMTIIHLTIFQTLYLKGFFVIEPLCYQGVQLSTELCFLQGGVPRSPPIAAWRSPFKLAQEHKHKNLNINWRICPAFPNPSVSTIAIFSCPLLKIRGPEIES